MAVEVKHSPRLLATYEAARPLRFVEMRPGYVVVELAETDAMGEQRWAQMRDDQLLDYCESLMAGRLNTNHTVPTGGGLLVLVGAAYALVVGGMDLPEPLTPTWLIGHTHHRHRKWLRRIDPNILGGLDGWELLTDAADQGRAAAYITGHYLAELLEVRR